MKRLLHTAITAFFCLSATLWFGCKEENTQFGSIYGIVSVAGTAEPIRGIGVSLHRYNTSGNNIAGDLLLRTTTFDDGSYTFVDILPDRYVVVAETPGYETMQRSIYVERERNARADLQLKPTNTYMVVRTLEPTVASSDVVLKGTVSLQNNTQPYEMGFYYSQSNQPTQNGNLVKGSIVDASGVDYSFETNLRNLQNGIYYVQAYAQNNYGRAYGDIRSFTISSNPGSNSFVVLADLDLMVQKIDLGYMCWEDAEKACENSTIGGYSDWRLPTLSELEILCQRKDEIGYLSGAYWSSSRYGLLSNHYIVYIGVDPDWDCEQALRDDYINNDVRAVRTISK